MGVNNMYKRTSRLVSIGFENRFLSFYNISDIREVKLLRPKLRPRLHPFQKVFAKMFFPDRLNKVVGRRLCRRLC